MYTVTLSKIQVAARQLDTAVWLWFHSGDLVSILTLTDATMGVLDGVFFATRKSRPHPFTEEFVPKGMTMRQYRAKIQEAGAFAKHARNDPAESYEYKEYWIGAYLFLAIGAYTQLVKPYDPKSLRAVFATWYGIYFPVTYQSGVSIEAYSKYRIKIERLKKLSRIEFLNEAARDFGVDFGIPPQPDGLRP